MRLLRSACCLAVLCVPGSGFAAEPVLLEPVQVTATREPVAVAAVPASISTVSGEELRARGAKDLRSALALVAGVEGTPGGDAGGAGAVPALWGLREADAYLLVVDGVPWGGAFNPATPTLDLTGVERIEVLRGAAPVMYGATAFNGVIYVIHYAAGQAANEFAATAGSYDSFGVSGTLNLPGSARYQQSASATIAHRGYRGDRQEYDRYHLLYRAASGIGAGRLHLDADLGSLPQTPGNVIYRNGAQLRTDILPPDANHNPVDAKLDQRRAQLAAGYDLATGLGVWSSTLALTRTLDDLVRGFLRDDAPAAGADGFDADGYAQKRQITDLYFDSHLSFTAATGLQFTTGLDGLYGKGRQSANNFGYFVSLDGSDAPASGSQHVDEIARSENRRLFTGLYAQMDWQPLASVDVLAGLRLNHSQEKASGEAIANDQDQMQSKGVSRDQLDKTRLSGTAGLVWHLLKAGRDSLSLYGDYRNTYKPKATDFGPEAEVDIQQPETASSYEVGLRGAWFDGHYEYELSAFRLDFKNLLTFAANGEPIAGGRERFQGAEYEGRYALTPSLKLMGNYAYHDSRFTQLTLDDGTELSGKRLELSPYHLAGLGLLYLPAQGCNATLVANYVGERKLNKRNTAHAGGYTTLDASLGYQFKEIGLQLNGYNLSDRRVPVAESELAETVSGASSYYLLPARLVTATVSLRF